MTSFASCFPVLFCDVLPYNVLHDAIMHVALCLLLLQRLVLLATLS